MIGLYQEKADAGRRIISRQERGKCEARVSLPEAGASITDGYLILLSRQEIQIQMNDKRQFITSPGDFFSRTRIRFIKFICLVVSVIMMHPAAFATPEATHSPYRIGIVTYDDITSRQAAIEKAFAETNHPLRFAGGTAEEVLDWVTSGLVDIAVLSPGALAATGAPLRIPDRNKRINEHSYPGWDARYLITPALLPSENPFASPQRKKFGGFVFEELILADKESWNELKKQFPGSSDAATVVAAAQAGKVQFVFGDPLSLSGTIVPKAQLARIGLSVGDGWEYSFGHKDTIDLLLDEPQVVIKKTKKVRLGFIYDGSIPGAPPELFGDDRKAHVAKRIKLMEDKLVSLRLPPPEEPVKITLEMPGGPKDFALPQKIVPADNDPPLAIDDLPAEVWVVRTDFGGDEIKKLREELLKVKDDSGRPLFVNQNDPNVVPNPIDTLNERVQLWARKGGVDLGSYESTRKIQFAEIVHSMRHFERRFNTGARLALVLSGGGAKCSYQAGVIDMLERLLPGFEDYKVLPPTVSKDSNIERIPPDISLVVGTSGGALNALPAAIGVTTAPTEQVLGRLWTSVELVQLLDVYPATGAAVGLAFGIFLAVVTWWCAVVMTYSIRIIPIIVRRTSASMFGVESVGLSADIHGLVLRISSVLKVIVLVLLAALFAIQSIAPDVLQSVTPNSVVIYYLLWLPLNVGGMWTLATLLAASVLDRFCLNRPSRTQTCDIRKWVLNSVLSMICVVVFASAVALFANKSFVKGVAVRTLIMTSYKKLLGNSIAESQCVACGTDMEETALSNAIANESVTRRRDLVMPVTILGSKSTADRYVYLPAVTTGGKPPTYQERALKLGQSSGITFLQDTTNLVPFLIASGSIYPLFPPKSFMDATGVSKTVKAVDGGFAHNSPVEAALDWGATHIIVVEASAKPEFEESNTLFQNLGVAFDHLFEQAQLTDLRSREKVEIYVIRPQQEILKTLDFVPSMLRIAIEQGAEDVRKGQFKQSSRPPIFVDQVRQDRHLGS